MRNEIGQSAVTRTTKVEGEAVEGSRRFRFELEENRTTHRWGTETSHRTLVIEWINGDQPGGKVVLGPSAVAALREVLE